jgi:hypothetical protein
MNVVDDSLCRSLDYSDSPDGLPRHFTVLARSRCRQTAISHSSSLDSATNPALDPVIPPIPRLTTYDRTPLRPRNRRRRTSQSPLRRRPLHNLHLPPHSARWQSAIGCHLHSHRIRRSSVRAAGTHRPRSISRKDEAPSTDLPPATSEYRLDGDIQAYPPTNPGDTSRWSIG